MTLKYAGFLNEFRRKKGWSIHHMAEKIGVTDERMENLLAGKHEPKAADTVRMERGLEIMFDPEDFETEWQPEVKRA